MNCIYCGAQLHEGAVFCFACGQEVVNAYADMNPKQMNPQQGYGQQPYVQQQYVQQPNVQQPYVQQPYAQQPQVQQPYTQQQYTQANTQQPNIQPQSTPQQSAPQQSASQQNIQQPTPPKKKKKWIPIVIAAVASVLVIGGGLFGYFYIYKQVINNPSKLLTQAMTYMNNNEYDKALDNYQRVLKFDPTNEEAYAGVANVYIKKGEEEFLDGNYSEGLDLYRQALKHLKNYPGSSGYIERRIAGLEKNIADKENSITPVTSNSPPSTTVQPPNNPADSGDTLTIFAWNDEWKGFVEDYMPGYTPSGNTDGYLDGLPVHWEIVYNDDGAYQKALDETFANNSKDIDIFLVEADYSAKYINSGLAMPLSELGISDLDLVDQYNYTKQVVTHEGEIYGSAWMTCGSGMIYNRQIAKTVLGTDDPVAVQAMVSDWDDWYDVAEKMKKAGYQMTPTVYGTYRAFEQGRAEGWVDNGQVNIDENILMWKDISKSMVDEGMAETEDIWSYLFENDGPMYRNSTFCLFGPDWFYDYCFAADDVNSIASNGGWAFCEGPQAHFWGGTWVCVATKSDNVTPAANLMKTMTTDENILDDLATEQGVQVNNRNLINRYASDYSKCDPVLGNQNPYAVLKDLLEDIDVPEASKDEQLIGECYQNAMKEYFEGTRSYADAESDFSTQMHYMGY